MKQKTFIQLMEALFFQMQKLDKKFDHIAMKKLKNALHTKGGFTKPTINKYMVKGGGKTEDMARRLFEYASLYVKNPISQNENVKD
jgi:hypothetical protein